MLLVDWSMFIQKGFLNWQNMKHDMNEIGQEIQAWYIWNFNVNTFELKNLQTTFNFLMKNNE